MPRFNYRARTSEGQLIQGEVDAEDQSHAAAYVLDLGATPLSLQQSDSQKLSASTDVGQLIARYLKRPIPLNDLIIFARHFRSLLHAGVPVIRALRGLAENAQQERLKEALNSVAGSLEGGTALADSMNEHSDVFPPLFIHMMRVGEQSGQLESALTQMADNLEQERQTRERIKSALRYPTFVLIAILGAFVVVNVFVIPTFADLFESLDTQLPFATRALLATSSFTQQYGVAMLVAAAAGVLLLRYYLRGDTGRLQWDRFKLRIPIAGPVMRRALLARFTRTFAMALRAGVPLLTAIDTVADATDNAYVSQGIRGLRSGIERGESLHTVCERSGLFTPMVLQMLAVGEETGQLADLMDQVADFYESEVDEDLKRLPSYIEPIMIGFIGLLVLVLAAGIFMPIWQMSSAF
ncbi:type II secretion system F family protein [Spiribacter aquaticus]|uniref:Type II secretion system F family protein n=1 Tax=Spiribacter aquaticus TaxID=1935996 RepID=A0A557RJ96_9GAMM|nr:MULTISPECIES: type II secretion system F family protein [Spiribacter]KAF0280240.1 MSHA biogenesis protein MshG [Spiribacter roseus]TVO65225.1 type II secretion system F family protein [Spiribacter aquaticus]